MNNEAIPVANVVDLTRRPPLLESKSRLIYEYPDCPQFLIKVHRSRLSNAESSNNWVLKQKDFFLYRSGILRDLSQYVESRYAADSGVATERILPIFGVVPTTSGLGLLVQCARDANGALAPTARFLIKNRQMTSSRIADLRLLVQAIIDSPLNFADINLWNFVLQDADSSEEKFVLIDGLGDKTFVPVQKWLPFLRKRKKKSFQAFLERSLREAGYE